MIELGLSDEYLDGYRAGLRNVPLDKNETEDWKMGWRNAVSALRNKQQDTEQKQRSKIMSQIITAPSVEKPIYISVFLAGGITNCKEWQKEVIREMEYEEVSIYNPRQEHFDITNKNAAVNQIVWEYEWLEQMDIFSMYFCNSDSDQPICMYELGRNIVRMQNRFPSDWNKRIVVSVEDGYRRKQDVLIQIGLCAPTLFVETDATPETHALHIKYAVRQIRNRL